MSKKESKQVAVAPVAPEGQNPIVTAGYDRQEMYDEHKTKSAVIRLLGTAGYKTGDIAKFLEIRYQHARNVLKTPTKKQAEPTAPSAS